MEEGIGCDVDDEKMNRNGTCKDSGDAIVKGDEVESTKSEMSGVMEENKRLKTLIKQIEKDYKALQMKFNYIFQQDSNKSGSPSPTINGAGSYPDDREEQYLVSLRLGTSPDGHKKEGIHVAGGSSKVTAEDHELELGLGYNLRGLKADDGFSTKIDECKGDGKVGEKWPPSRVLKTQRSGDDEFPQTGVKKARVCVRARCDAPTMNDGCQWRKYGQKIAKGNPCPRAYYRCTVSPSCPVKKQVQRCVDDMSILITTYEGTHNHPLPVSATAMAATTSAAASMLLSGSSTSQAPATGAPPTYPFGSTLHPFDNSRTRPYNLLLNSSSTPFPTITLDLTPNLSTTHGGFSLYSTNARASATDLSFSSVDSSMIPTGSSNGGFPYGRFSYDSGHQYSLLPGEPIQQQKYQPQLEKLNQASSKQALTETLTNAIKTDPSFQSVIAAAISAMAANGGAGKVNNDKGENLDQNLNWGEHRPATGSNQLTSNAKNS